MLDTVKSLLIWVVWIAVRVHVTRYHSSVVTERDALVMAALDILTAEESGDISLYTSGDCDDGSVFAMIFLRGNVSLIG